MKLLIFVILITLNQCESRTVDSTKKAFEFEDVIPNKFSSRGFDGTWISGKEFTFTENNDLVNFHVDSKQKTKTVYDKNFAAKWKGASLTMSVDESKVLIRYDRKTIFRHSSVAKFSIVYKDDLNKEYKLSNGELLQFCTLSSKGDSLIYIKDNTVYYTNDEMIKAGQSPRKLSNNGEPGVIYNGIPDWVYEEEVLGTGNAAWFSPDGKHLAYASFDDTDVPEYMYEIYGDGKGEYQYPQEIRLRYPKVGEKNPRVDLYLVNVQSSIIAATPLKTPVNKVTNDHILGRVFWITDTLLGAIWLNRRQNIGVMVSYKYVNDDFWDIETIADIKEPNGWIDLNTPKCEKDGNTCYFINIANNWPSLTRINVKDKTLTPLTRNKHVLDYFGSRDGKLYYSATPSPDKSFNRHTYVLNNDQETCLTCHVESPEGNKCSMATTIFSTDLSYYAATCSGPDVSFTRIYLTDSSSQPIPWQNNDAVRASVAKFDMPQVKIFHVKVGGTFNAAVKLQLPAEIDFENPERVSEKYPLLVRVYGGPGSVRVWDNFGIGFQSYQITSKKIIYAEIDGRGTGQKGADMMFSINNRLGTYDAEDQIMVTKYLTEKYSFIDKQRVGIWGWSYGGYASAMALAKDLDNVFKCGVSVAPVTSWILYDTIYTERFMGVDPNARNYNTSDVTHQKFIETIGEHDFLLIHGNADDNVHYQQSMILAGALERADIMFEQMSYPDEAHSLSGVSSHLYHLLDRFWDKCFDL